MNPELEAIPCIDANAARHDISWVNTRRAGANWKVRLYEQSGTGRQLAIYQREATIIRLERMVDGIEGVRQLDRCPISHGLEMASSRFKGGVGVCVSVESVDALGSLLGRYFADMKAALDLREVQSAFDAAISVAKRRTRAERLARLELAPNKSRRVTVVTTAFLRNADVVAVTCLPILGPSET